MGHGDRFLVPYLLFKKSIVWDEEPVPVSHSEAWSLSPCPMKYQITESLSGRGG